MVLVNESKLKFKTDLIPDWYSSSADDLLCPAAAEDVRVPVFQMQSPDGLPAADEVQGTLENQPPRPFAK